MPTKSYSAHLLLILLISLATITGTFLITSTSEAKSVYSTPLSIKTPEALLSLFAISKLPTRISSPALDSYKIFNFLFAKQIQERLKKCDCTNTMLEITLNQETYSYPLTSILPKCISTNGQILNDECLLNFIKQTEFYKKYNGANYILTNKKGQQVTIWGGDIQLNTSALISDIKQQLTAMILKQIPTKKTINIKAKLSDLLPNTDGTFANRYLEADGSRQLMFYWENGKYRTFHMSGAYKYWNPVGIHQFFYKSEKAWSKYRGVWMPYWMAFATDPNQDNALLGVHGLIYWCPDHKYRCDPDEYIYENKANIGIPRSRGCLRLKDEDILFLYNKIQVGDYIIVHD